MAAEFNRPLSPDLILPYFSWRSLEYFMLYKHTLFTEQ